MDVIIMLGFRQTVRQTDRQKDRQTDRQTDRQIDSVASIRLSIHPSIHPSIHQSTWKPVCFVFSSLLFSCLVLSYICSFILSCFFPLLQSASHFIAFHLISSHLISSHLISFHFISSHLISSCRMLCMYALENSKARVQVQVQVQYSTNDEMGAKGGISYHILFYSILFYYIILDEKQLPYPTKPLCHAMPYHTIQCHITPRLVTYYIILE